MAPTDDFFDSQDRYAFNVNCANLVEPISILEAIREQAKRFTAYPLLSRFYTETHARDNDMLQSDAIAYATLRQEFTSKLISQNPAEDHLDKFLESVDIALAAAKNPNNNNAVASEEKESTVNIKMRLKKDKKTLVLLFQPGEDKSVYDYLLFSFGEICKKPEQPSVFLALEMKFPEPVSRLMFRFSTKTYLISEATLKLNDVIGTLNTLTGKNLFELNAVEKKFMLNQDFSNEFLTERTYTQIEANIPTSRINNVLNGQSSPYSSNNNNNQ